MKNLILLLVVIVASFNLAGCGSDSKSKTCAECGEAFTADSSTDTLCEKCAEYIKERESGNKDKDKKGKDNKDKGKAGKDGKSKEKKQAGPTGSSAAK